MKHDKELLQRRFSRNLRTYDTLAVVQRSIADRLGGELAVIDPPVIRRGVEIGAGTGFLTRHLVRLFPAAEWTVNDLVPASRDYLPPVTGTGTPVRFTPGDGEAFDFGQSRYDLIASASAVQWFDDLPAFIARSAAGLAPGGLLALTTFGPENFREITATTGQGLAYLPADQLSALCRQEGMELLFQCEWLEQQHYPSPVEVLRHLRLTGVNAVTSESWTHRRLRQFESDYRAAFTRHPDPTEKNETEYVTLTFHPIILIARKP